MDMERPTRGEKIIVACGAVLLITSWLPLWAKYEYRDGADRIFGPSRTNAWSDAFTVVPKSALVLVLLVLGAVLVRVVVRASLPWPPGRIYVLGGAVAAALLLLTALVGPNEFGYASLPGFDISRGPMLLVAWALGAGIAYGGWLHVRESDPHGVGSAYPPRGPVVLR
ncbi:MAG: hypothetical protein GEU78_09390 [Actinobacteria bacterium]|nr:hypothetical protein [Actinomycetota bacterium]